jgi:oligogalacturonide lyase
VLTYNQIVPRPIDHVRRVLSSRREFLASLAPLALAARSTAAESTLRGQVLPSIAVKYLDPATEFVIVRTTDPQYNSLLPSGGTRPLSNRGMLYASDVTGKWEAFRMDLHTFESRQLTDAMALDPQSLSFQAGEKGFWHFDAGRLIETNLLAAKEPGCKTREVYRCPDGFEKTAGIGYADDGREAVFVEKSAAGYRLRLLDLVRGTARTLVETTGAEEMGDALIRPKHASALYRVGNAYWLMDFSTGKKRQLALAEGEVLQCQWTSDGRSLLYLSRPEDAKKLTEIREFVPESGSDAGLAKTSQFVRFFANTDASVFAGASGTKASPYVLLLARTVKREFTLAEHKASDPRMVAPMFTPNSQSLLFQSDRHGKPAIYWMAVEKFVAETEGS